MLDSRQRGERLPSSLEEEGTTSTPSSTAAAAPLDLGLLRDVNLSAGNTAALLLAFVMLGVFFVMSLFLQVVLGYSAATPGAILSPLSIALMLAAILAGRFCAGVSPRWLIAGGAACTTLNVAIAVAIVGAVAALFLRRPRSS